MTEEDEDVPDLGVVVDDGAKPAEVVACDARARGREWGSLMTRRHIPQQGGFVAPCHGRLVHKRRLLMSAADSRSNLKAQSPLASTRLREDRSSNAHSVE